MKFFSRPPDHPPGHRNKVKDSYYEVRVKCANCGGIYDVKVKKGTLAQAHLNYKLCENCGCDTLKVMK